MPIPVLESVLKQNWDKALPSSIGHDIHRPAGWNEIIALHLQPGIARIFGAVHYAENDEDMKAVRDVLNQAMSRNIVELDQEKVGELKRRLGNTLSADGKLHPQGCAAFYDPGLARRMFPTLFAKCDKDGLISLAELKCVAPGVFEQEGLLLFAHQFFRRSLSRYNTLNDAFLRRLSATAKDAKLDVRIALDEDLVGHPAALLENIELQYWWGPHFSEKLDEIRLGMTRHEASQRERLFSGISTTEFWWYEQDERKTFECEEIRDLNVPSIGKSASEFGCRFVHSIVDSGDRQAIHLDGAVRLYSEDLMLERVDRDIMQFGRRAEYTKLWRIDGLLAVETWKALINDYYRDNHLVGEYLGGKEEGEEAMRPKAIKIDEACSIYTYAPCTMAPGDGIRIAISYHPHSTNTSARLIVPTEGYNRGEGWVHYVEAGTIELIKLVRRRKETIDLPDRVAVVAFEDMVTNLPLIEHCTSEALHQAQNTLEVIRDYCLALKGHDDDRMLGFHLSIRFPDRDAHFSFVGHVNDMCMWLQSDHARLPETVDAIGQWADAACAYLTDTYPNSRDVPPLESMIQTTGLLIVGRKFLLAEEFALTSSNPLSISLVRCPSIDRALPLVKERSLVCAPAFIIKTSECQRCNISYRDCGCINIVDSGVSERVTDADMLAVFWTDRSAYNVAPVDELSED
jgi:hypothetical protein